MRRSIAHGVAAVLLVVSLGAAQGPTSSESRSNVPQKSRVTVKKQAKPYQVGTASWYGDYFQGKPTASGEPYDMFDLTAAHPTLPLGTYVRVTNLRNGRSVVVKVNDRPHCSGPNHRRFLQHRSRAPVQGSGFAA